MASICHARRAGRRGIEARAGVTAAFCRQKAGDTHSPGRRRSPLCPSTNLHFLVPLTTGHLQTTALTREARSCDRPPDSTGGWSSGPCCRRLSGTRLAGRRSQPVFPDGGFGHLREPCQPTGQTLGSAGFWGQGTVLLPPWTPAPHFLTGLAQCSQCLASCPRSGRVGEEGGEGQSPRFHRKPGSQCPLRQASLAARRHSRTRKTTSGTFPPLPPLPWVHGTYQGLAPAC